MLAVQNTPTPIRMGTLHRLPATARGRQKLLSRIAQHPILPPTDGSVSEWWSWGSVTLACPLCTHLSCSRLRLVLNNCGGAYTFWRPCDRCGHVVEELSVSRQRVIDEGRRLRGWSLVPDVSSLLRSRRARADELQRKRETIASLQRQQRPRPDSPPPPRGA